MNFEYTPSDHDTQESLEAIARSFPDDFLFRVGRVLDRGTEQLHGVPFNANNPTGPSMRDWYSIVMNEISERYPGRLAEVLDGTLD